MRVVASTCAYGSKHVLSTMSVTCLFISVTHTETLTSCHTLIEIFSDEPFNQTNSSLMNLEVTFIVTWTPMHDWYFQQQDITDGTVCVKLTVRFVLSVWNISNCWDRVQTKYKLTSLCIYIKSLVITNMKTLPLLIHIQCIWTHIGLYNRKCVFIRKVTNKQINGVSQ